MYGIHLPYASPWLTLLQDSTQLVYEAIVYIISVFLDDKAMRTDERDALDMYIAKHFNAPNAHRHLMSVLKKTFTSSEPNAAKGIGLSLKVLLH